eukprot:TRINITY_DN11908_c0_g1_i5.p1 TRINITY_DN11908_c0_g1~~TRINITY_DN11908_c0_g1_i5.p1  ORF type:complete len:221 (+),score=69.26 TRINITY_DN11908_c0_g1_i5:133-795(+)
MKGQKMFKYSILQLVMGKIRGYASWPALVLARSTTAKAPYYVSFIADESFAYLQENQMQNFDEKSVEDITEAKNKNLQVALQCAMQIYRQEITIEEYLMQYPSLLAMKDLTLVDVANNIKKNIENVLITYRIVGMVEYTVDQIETIKTSNADTSRCKSITELIERKVDMLLRHEKLRERTTECEYSKEKVVAALSEFKECVRECKEELVSKIDRLIEFIL